MAGILVCAVDMVKAINGQLINRRAALVTRMRDLVGKSGDTAESAGGSEDIRAAIAEEPSRTGPESFPAAATHHSHPLAAAEFKPIYLQTQDGHKPTQIEPTME